MHPNDGRVVSNFVIQALKNEPITIYGNGGQTRSFCYVDDLVELMLLFMDSDDDFTGPMNMGNPTEITIRELAETIIDISNSRSTLDEKELPEDDPKRRRPDISLARDKLGWEPKVGLRDGLSKTIKYFETLLQVNANTNSK